MLIIQVSPLRFHPPGCARGKLNRRYTGKIRSSRGRGLRHPRDTGLSGSPVWASSTDVTALRSI